MAYKVIRPFRDLTDPNKHDYTLDETYPRDGHKPSDEFIEGLLTGSNSAGSIFLATANEELEIPEDDKHTDEEPELPEGDKPTEEPVEKPKRKRTNKKVED